MQHKTSRPPLSPLRKAFFPIYNDEFKKFVPLSLIFFFISINYAVLRGLKDTFMMSIPQGGAELIAAAKFAGVIPAMMFFKLSYDMLSQRTERDGRFNAVIIYFIGFFSLFAFYLRPHQHELALDGLASWLQGGKLSVLGLFTVKGIWFKKVWLMLRHWPATLFYIHAEAWGTFALSVLFWTFMNAITSVHQSKRFYSTIALSAAVATFLAGVLVQASEAFSIGTLLYLVLANCLCLVLTYNVFARAINRDPAAYQVPMKGRKKKKLKLSISESIAFLFKSSYLGLIAVLVCGYSMAISLFEAVYRDCLRQLVGHDQALLRYWSGMQLQAIGAVSMVLIIFVSAPVIRRSWHFAASLTPRIMLFGTLIFFCFLFGGSHLGFLEDYLGASLGSLTVALGLCNIVFIKSAKYVFFDPTKEMSYIPLDEESKVRGKSAVDGVGSRLGKGFGSFFITLLIEPIFGGVSHSRPLMSVMVFLVLFIWLWAVGRLNKRFKALTSSRPSPAKEVAVAEKK